MQALQEIDPWSQGILVCVYEWVIKGKDNWKQAKVVSRMDNPKQIFNENVMILFLFIDVLLSVNSL